jgi:hypothetical protein
MAASSGVTRLRAFVDSPRKYRSAGMVTDTGKDESTIGANVARNTVNVAVTDVVVNSALNTGFDAMLYP